MKAEHSGSGKPTLLYVDDFPFELSGEVAKSSAINPVFIRFEDVALPRRWLSETENSLVFDVQDRSNPRHEAERFGRWQQREGLSIRGLLNPSEPAQLFAHRFGRSLGLECLAEDVLERVRNKLVLKECLEQAGIAVAPYREVQNTRDLLDFGDQFGWPIVVKPIDGFSTINTFKLEREQAAAFDFPLPPVAGISNDWIAEQFISWREWECCALAHSGRVLQEFISYMPEPPLSIVDGAMNANITLRENEKKELGIDTRLLAQSIINAIGITTGYVHIEFFLSPSGQVLVSDVGNRLAGCEIPGNHARAYEFNIFQSLIDIHLGIEPTVPQLATRNVGDLLLPPTDVTLPSEDELREFEGVLEVKFADAPAEQASTVRSAHASSVTLHVEGNNYREVVRRMSHIFSWFRDR